MARFQPGTSGNPNGRPKGSVSPDTMTKNLFRPHLATVAERVLARALSGDPDACVAIISYMAAARKKAA